MELSIEATYENGVLKPAEALPLAEHERVRVVIRPAASWVDRTYGILKWNGDPKLLEQFATDPELDPQESA